jgi:hypothetical protein
MAIQKRTNAEIPLSAASVYTLLTGTFTAPAGADDTWDTLYFDGAEAAARLWRQHEAYLRAEARRLGIAPSSGIGGRLFFAEACALEHWR